MPTSKIVIGALALCLSGTLSPTVAGQTVAISPDAPVPATCTFSRPARVVTTMRDVPDVAAEFRRQKLAMADVGERFIPFDVEDSASKGLPHRQFVRAYIFDDRVIVWYYRGGFITNFRAIELRRLGDSDGSAPILRLTGAMLGGPLCLATQALLDGVNGQPGW